MHRQCIYGVDSDESHFRSEQTKRHGMRTESNEPLALMQSFGSFSLRKCKNLFSFLFAGWNIPSFPTPNSAVTLS